jgi:ABC-type uncharacterized transport system substrate-binding protein
MLKFTARRLEVFREAVPNLRRVTVLYNARDENPTHFASLTLLQKIAPTLGVTIVEKPIKMLGDVEKAPLENFQRYYRRSIFNMRHHFQGRE